MLVFFLNNLTLQTNLEMDRKFWANAFAMPRSERRHDELIAKIAVGVAKRRLAFPAILFLESVKPLNYLASQALIVLTPALGLFLEYTTLDDLADLLQERGNVERLIAAIDMENKRLENGGSPREENNQPGANTAPQNTE